MNNNYALHEKLIHATKEYSQTVSPSLPECTRLGGLHGTSVLQVNVFAFDASGNLSGNAYVEAPLPGNIPDVPAPGGVSAVMGVGHSVSLSWSGMLRPDPTCNGGGCRFWLYYALNGPAGPSVQGVGAIEGASPIDVGEATSLMLHALQPGGTYHFRVQSIDTQGRTGALSNDVALIVTAGIDANLDGLPDDWETFNNVSDPNADLDGDGLTNAEEYASKTNPNVADTDHDAFSDGEELVAGSNPIDSTSVPIDAQHLPRLQVSDTFMRFNAYTGSSDPIGSVTIDNIGGGVLTPTISADVPWLVTTLNSRTLQIRVSKSMLGNGHSVGHVIVSGAPGSRTQASPQSITIDVWLTTGNPPIGTYRVYLPVILR